MNPADDTGHTVNAQKYPAPNQSSSNMGATLFRVLAGSPCTINWLTVIGRRTGAGPVQSVTITVRHDAVSGMHHPAGANLAPGNTNIPSSSITVFGTTPYYNMTVPLTAPITLSPPPTGWDFYWVTFQAKMQTNRKHPTFWGWEVVYPDPAFNSDVWRNPAGGYGCGSTWKYVSDACLGSAPGKGLMAEFGP